MWSTGFQTPSTHGLGGRTIWNPQNPTQAGIWVFPKIGVPQKGWFIMENPIKIDDLGVPLFLEAPIYLEDFWGKQMFFSRYELRCLFCEDSRCSKISVFQWPKGTQCFPGL